jgi:hypothetical protein
MVTIMGKIQYDPFFECFPKKHESYLIHRAASSLNNYFFRKVPYVIILLVWIHRKDDVSLKKKNIDKMKLPSRYGSLESFFSFDTNEQDSLQRKKYKAIVVGGKRQRHI